MEQQQARSMSNRRRAIVWRLWHDDDPLRRVAKRPGETRDEWKARFSTPMRMDGAIWRDNIFELAKDGYLDADLADKRGGLMGFNLTPAGHQWANRFYKTKAGKREHKAFQHNMTLPYEDRPGRRASVPKGTPRAADGMGQARPIGETTIRKVLEAARQIGVADGEDVVVYPGDRAGVHERLADAAGWTRRSVSVVLSQMERNGDERIQVGRQGRHILSIRFVGIDGGLTFAPETVAAVQASLGYEFPPYPPVEAAQPVRPEPMDDPIPQITAAMTGLLDAVRLAYDTVRAERDEALALLEQATSPVIDPAVQEVLDAVARLNLSK